MHITELKEGEYASRVHTDGCLWGYRTNLAITRAYGTFYYVTDGKISSKVRKDSTAYNYDDFYLCDKKGNKLKTQELDEIKIGDKVRYNNEIWQVTQIKLDHSYPFKLININELSYNDSAKRSQITLIKPNQNQEKKPMKYEDIKVIVANENGDIWGCPSEEEAHKAIYAKLKDDPNQKFNVWLTPSYEVRPEPVDLSKLIHKY